MYLVKSTSLAQHQDAINLLLEFEREDDKNLPFQGSGASASEGLRLNDLEKPETIPCKMKLKGVQNKPDKPQTCGQEVELNTALCVQCNLIFNHVREMEQCKETENSLLLKSKGSRSNDLEKGPGESPERRGFFGSVSNFFSNNYVKGTILAGIGFALLCAGGVRLDNMINNRGNQTTGNQTEGNSTTTEGPTFNTSPSMINTTSASPTSFNASSSAPLIPTQNSTFFNTTQNETSLNATSSSTFNSMAFNETQNATQSSTGSNSGSSSSTVLTPTSLSTASSTTVGNTTVKRRRAQTTIAQTTAAKTTTVKTTAAKTTAAQTTTAKRTRVQGLNTDQSSPSTPSLNTTLKNTTTQSPTTAQKTTMPQASTTTELASTTVKKCEQQKYQIDISELPSTSTVTQVDIKLQKPGDTAKNKVNFKALAKGHDETDAFFNNDKKCSFTSKRVLNEGARVTGKVSTYPHGNGQGKHKANGNGGTVKIKFTQEGTDVKATLTQTDSCEVDTGYEKPCGGINHEEVQDTGGIFKNA